MLKNAAFLTLGNGLTSLFFLMRSVLAARLVPVEDYGIASTFVVVVALIEMTSQLSLDRMIVQDADGDRPSFQSGLQGLQLMRGVAGLAVLLMLAWPFAALLHVEEAAWGYMVIALVPLMSGLRHFDMFRMQRRMNYRPYLFVYLTAALISFLAVWPLDKIFGDWQVLLWAVLLQHFLIAVLSHLVAERPYRISFQRDLLRRGLGFGLPLLFNGILLFLVFHGEKLIVGRELGLGPLAYFAMGVSLTLTPTLVLSKSALALFLPMLSRVQTDTDRFAPIAYATLETSLLISLTLAAGVVIVGPPFVTFALGAKYEPMLAILIWLALAQGLRVAKTGLAEVSLARGMTGNAMLGNIPRVVGIAIAWWLVVRGGGFPEILAVAIIAECVGYAVALWRLRRQVGLPLRPLVLPIAFAAATLILVGWRALYDPPELTLWGHLSRYDLPWIAAMLGTVICSRSLRAFILNRRRKRVDGA